MRTFLRFLKPYRGLCLLTLLVMALDVAGALYLPTIVADMINIGVAGGDLDFILRKGGLMLGVALVSGGPRPSLRGPSGFWTGSAWWSGRTSPGPG